MSEQTLNKHLRAEGDERTCRALVVADESVPALEGQLESVGCETRRAATDEVPRAVEEFAPDVLLVAVGDSEEARANAVALVRRLRGDASTYALPVVILFQEDARALREAALAVGADDFFSTTTPPAEIRARLDALLWRVEAGRRAAASDQRSEIDNFLLLFEGVRADAESNRTGTFALIGNASGVAAHVSSLSEAHGFFKLNLRRADAVAFYGPTVLFAYLPGRNSAETQTTLAALREDFLRTREGFDLAVGVVSFPEDGKDVEQLIERAEDCLQEASAMRARSRVVAFGKPPEPVQASVAQADAPVVVEAEPQQSPTETPRDEPKPETVDEISREAEAVPEPTQRERPIAAAQSTREERMLDALEAATASLARSGAHDREGRGVSQSDSQASSKAAPELRGRTAGRGPRRLLLAVSDAARMAQLNLLIRSAAYEVRAAFDGQQALNLLRIERPDLVIVDHELKDMDGVEMLKRLRKQQGGRLSLPALLLLRAGEEEVRREATEIGARVVVPVPYNPEELLESIRTAGGEGGGAR